MGSERGQVMEDGWKEGMEGRDGWMEGGRISEVYLRVLVNVGSTVLLYTVVYT